MNRAHVRERIEDSTFELNLAPMLDMLTVLITVLLVSFTSVRLGILDGLIPQPVLTALEKDRQNKDREVQVTVSMSPTVGFTLEVTESNKKPVKIQIPNVSGKMDLVRLHKELVQAKLLKTDNFRVELNPSEDASYEDIVLVMDQMRNTSQSDGKIHIKDEKSGQLVETNLLFPDIVFNNAVEG